MNARRRSLDRSLELVLAQVRTRARLRTEWLRTLWREVETGPAAGAITHAEVDLTLDDRDNPADESRWLRRQANDEDRSLLAEIETAQAGDADSRLSLLENIFDLTPVERDLLHCCLAADLDPALLRVYAYLQDIATRAQVTAPLVARLFGHGRTLPVDAAAALFRWALVEVYETPMGEPAYRLGRSVFQWLAGGDALDATLAGLTRNLGHPRDVEQFAAWPIEETAKELSRWLDDDRAPVVRVEVSGVAGSGRRTFAGLVAHRCDRPLLCVDAAGADESRWPQIELAAHRQALISGAALAISPPAWFWTHPARAPLPATPAVPLQFVISEGERVLPGAGLTADYTVVLPPLSLDGRRELWRRHAPWSADWPGDAFKSMVRQHRAQPGDIVRIAQRGPATVTETATLLRAAARESLGELAQRIDCTFTRDDLVVGPQIDDALDDLLFEATDRSGLWEQPAASRLFPQGRGLLALFSGPPGTGKTMSAQVVAAELGMDLFRIDLAAVVSKWVGETSRNLDRLLRRAADLDVVLLFDEADALFGKRTEVKEANDRFANTDTGFLLQAIESYRGIALLSTNRKGDVDPAFIRRLRYVLDFPVPTEQERLKLWHGLVTHLAGEAPARRLQPDLERIAAGVEMTGAQIKLAVLTGVFASRRGNCEIGAAHLVRGLERELAKEGRPLSDRLRERLAGHGQ